MVPSPKTWDGFPQRNLETHKLLHSYTTMPVDYALTSTMICEGESIGTVLSGWSIALIICRRSATQTTMLSPFPNLIPVGSSAGLGAVHRRAKPPPLITLLIATLDLLWMVWPIVGPLDDHDFARRLHAPAHLHLNGAPRMPANLRPDGAASSLDGRQPLVDGAAGTLPDYDGTTRPTAPTTTSGEGHPHIYFDGENISRVF